MRIAIVGAGMAGLACARALAAAGHDPLLFDKGRGPGGRMSTRRTEHDGRTLSFDHGAQYFTARDEAFVALVRAVEAEGAVVRWPAVGDDTWTGAGRMSEPIAALAARFEVHFATVVETIAVADEGWRIDTLNGTHEADALVVAIPAEQAATLLADVAPDMATKARATPSDPCWTVMAAYDAPLDAPDMLRDQGVIGWAVRESARPGRDPGERWVVQAGPDWSTTHLEDPADAVIAALLDRFADAVGAPAARSPAFATAHRWRFAMSGTLHEDFLMDEVRRLGVCGDWLLGPRVENAFLSGHRLGTAMGEAI